MLYLHLLDGHKLDQAADNGPGSLWLPKIDLLNVQPVSGPGQLKSVNPLHFLPLLQKAVELVWGVLVLHSGDSMNSAAQSRQKILTHWDRNPKQFKNGHE